MLYVCCVRPFVPECKLKETYFITSLYLKIAYFVNKVFLVMKSDAEENDESLEICI